MGSQLPWEGAQERAAHWEVVLRAQRESGTPGDGPLGAGLGWAGGVCPTRAVTSRRALLCGAGAGTCGRSPRGAQGVRLCGSSPPSLGLLKNTTGSGSPARSADALHPRSPGPQPGPAARPSAPALPLRLPAWPPAVPAPPPPPPAASVPVLSGRAPLPGNQGWDTCHCSLVEGLTG